MIRFSGWITLYFDLPKELLEELFKELGDLFLVRVGRLVDEPVCLLESFLEKPEQLALTRTLEAIDLKSLPDGRTLASPKEPVIILAPSPHGLKAAYPRIFQKDEAIHKTFPEGRFANTSVFMNLQRFLRRRTKPVKKNGQIVRVVIDN